MPVTRYPTKPHDQPIHGKRANGRFKNGRVMKHEPYAKRPLAAPTLQYRLPVEGWR